MMGAHQLIYSSDSLTFKVRGSRRANVVKVTLCGDDTYRVECMRVNRRTWATQHSLDESGVMCDMLRSAIERGTGLALSL